MMTRFLLSALLALAAPQISYAQDKTFCERLFETLSGEIEANYAAYVIEYAGRPESLSRYRAMKEGAQRSAGRARDRTDCTRTLSAYVGFFSDPHLVLVDTPRFDRAVLDELRTTAPRASVGVEQARASAPASTDPVTGIWATPEGDVAITPVANGYEAIVVVSTHEDWSPGDLRARLSRSGEGFEVILYQTRDRYPVLQTHVAVEGDLRLRLSGLAWGRRDPMPDWPPGFDPAEPRKPLYIDHSDDVGVLILPSFDPGKVAEAAEAILAEHGPAIVAKRLLVIDIRGNEGGSASEWRRFAPLYATGSWEPIERRTPGSGDVVLAAPRTVAAFERDLRFAEGELRANLEPFVARLKAAPPGTLVPYIETDSTNPITPWEPETPFEGPAAIAVLTDSLVVSAGEAFLLHARRSPKVTVFGENSMGSIDYWTTRAFGVGQGGEAYTLIFPIGASSNRLPEGGYNTDGVPVDVRLSGHHSTWLPQVLAHYGLR